MITNIFLTNIIIFIVVFIFFVLVSALKGKKFRESVRVFMGAWMILTVFSILAYLIYLLWS